MDRRDRRSGRQRGQQPQATPVRKRRVSRAEREARRQRQLYIGVGIVGALIVLILAGGAINEYFIKPRQVLATVDGVNIRRRDYWKYRSYELIQQISQYNQLAQIYGGEQGQQYQSFALAAQQELQDVWGSTDVNESTLEQMVEDQVYLHNMGELGIVITDQDIDNWINQQFEPSNAPLFTPTPSPTLIPTRAGWATETAVAGATQTAEAQLTATAAATETAEAASSPGGEGAASPGATPEGSPSQKEPAGVPAAATPALPATPDAAGSPEGTPPADGSPVASPEGSPAASPVASPVASPTVAPTPNPEQALSTAEAGYREYRDAVFDEAHLSEADYVRLIVRPSIARERVRAVLEAQVGQTAEQVHAAHILVDTADLARSLRDQLNQPGASFEELARTSSTDTSTAPNGGDLGWFTRNMMVAPFADVAFSLQPGQISEPFETEFGWHIVLVYEHQADRPMTDEQIQAEKDAVVEQWIQAKMQAAEINSDHLEPTATPAPGSQEFVPPPDAPPTPTASPTPLASPVASPVGSPAASPVAGDGTPVPGATPVETGATPDEVASPDSAPPASTVAASPAA